MRKKIKIVKKEYMQKKIKKCKIQLIHSYIAKNNGKKIKIVEFKKCIKHAQTQ